jgi:hypothetical protein
VKGVVMQSSGETYKMPFQANVPIRAGWRWGAGGGTGTYFAVGVVASSGGMSAGRGGVRKGKVQ